METFVSHYRSLVTAVLCGFDRLVFRGTLLPLVRPGGMFIFLTRAGVQLLDFKAYVLRTSERVIESSVAEARRLDRPVIYLQSSAVSKEDLARRILAETPGARGLICALRIVEPCMSFEYHRSQDHGERGLKLRPRKCLHIYKYWMHPRFGFMSARIQTWFPFNVQVCLNGREWLATELQRHRIDFTRHDNCFTWLGSEPACAQRLMDQQLTLDWPAALDAVAGTLNPEHAAIFKLWPMSYYWSAYQTEWATDLLFKDPRSLAAVYPALVRHATEHFASPDVMRFLQRKAHGNFTGELVTSFKHRPEGVRVKHWLNGNSIKMYDKAGSVLRVETTIARTTDFKVYRPKQGEPDGKLAWLPLRKGVADLHRRAELSQRANTAYLDALAAVNDDTPLSTVLDAVSRHTTWRGRRVRPGASGPCASATPPTSLSSKPSRAASSPPPACETATCADCSSPPDPTPTTAKSEGSPRASPDSCACSAPTVSSTKSNAAIATSSAQRDANSPPRSSPHAPQPSSSSSRRPHESCRAIRRFSGVVDQGDRVCMEASLASVALSPAPAGPLRAGRSCPGATPPAPPPASRAAGPRRPGR